MFPGVFGKSSPSLSVSIKSISQSFTVQICNLINRGLFSD